MNAAQNFATHSFAHYAAKNIRVDQDKAGLFCQVPDQSGRWYTVRCMESKKSVYANHCNCSTFAAHQRCNPHQRTSSSNPASQHQLQWGMSIIIGDRTLMYWRA